MQQQASVYTIVACSVDAIVRRECPPSWPSARVAVVDCPARGNGGCERAGAKRRRRATWRSFRDMVVDLKYRGDYTTHSRRKLQKHMVNNNLEGFVKVIVNKDNWRNVPPALSGPAPAEVEACAERDASEFQFTP